MIIHMRLFVLFWKWNIRSLKEANRCKLVAGDVNGLVDDVNHIRLGIEIMEDGNLVLRTSVTEINFGWCPSRTIVFDIAPFAYSLVENQL